MIRAGFHNALVSRFCIFKELAEGPRRYGELARAIAGASQKMLTQTLRRLERDGLLSRTVTPAVPVRVDYALTPLGQSLLPVIQAVTRWAEQNIQQIDVARVNPLKAWRRRYATSALSWAVDAFRVCAI